MIKIEEIISLFNNFDIFFYNIMYKINSKINLLNIKINYK